jgi:hypothetical protein
MILLSPADSSVPIAWAGGDDARTDVSVRVGVDVGSSAFIIRTIERVGQRMSDAGHVSGVVDDPRTMAESVVTDSLLSLLDETYPRNLLATRMQQIVEQAKAIDWKQWEFTQIMVDGVGFALRVRRQQSGFVAIADLGTAVVTMRGKKLPSDRRFTVHRHVAFPSPDPE